MNNASGGLSLFETDGFSMWPFLNPSERLIVRKAAAEDLRLGDLVLYRSGDNLICHRFLRRVDRSDGRYIYTQADAACLTGPALIPESAISGKVVAVVRGKGVKNLEGTLHRLINILIIPAAPALCAIFNAYRWLRRKR